MDEDSDLDNSLIDLHHGLDSSFDENASGFNAQELATTPHASVSMENHSRKDLTDNHVSTLQDMVLEMKEGFQTALKELTKIQDKEEGDAQHSKKLQQQQQRQLDDLTETIYEIKNQLSSLTSNVKQIQDEQKTLKDHLDEVRSNRSSSQEGKFHSNGDRMDMLDSFSVPPGDWKTKLSELPAEFDGQTTSSRWQFETDDDDVTVTACKSLAITQALNDKCLTLNLSQSSDEDEEEEGRRVSHYIPKTTSLVLNQMENRRHSISASTVNRNRGKDLDIAAQRQKAVKELADSERDYCCKLWALLHTYMTPLETANFLSARDLGTIFPQYLDQLYTEHRHICTGLQDRLAHWTHMGGVADLLARITDSLNSDSVLSLYKNYADALLSAVRCLKRIMAHSSKFRSFLKTLKHSSCQNEDLMSLLLAPMKHMPKYLLKLQQVSHHTPPTHPDFPLLQTSLRRLRTFVDQLNEDLSVTAQALNQDRHTWSNNNSGQILSARDSGIHSNSTEDDVMPAKVFSKVKRNHMPPEWLEEPHFIVHHHQSNDILRQRHFRAPASRLSALSQPDLTVYNNLNSHNSDPHFFAHMPRSQSTIPAADVDSGDETARGRQYRKFRVIKKRNQSPGDYVTTPRGHIYRSLSPHVRPVSAVDFLSHSNYHQYHHQGTHRDLPLQSKKPQYQEREGRHHTVLGSHAADPHKPTIISRKHFRQSQPPIPTSTNYWAEISTSSTMPFQVRHQRVPLSTHDMLPKQSSYYTASDVLDGDDEEEEDDTKASDTHSFGTNGSHAYSSGHGSYNGHEFDLDFYQDNLGGNSPQSLLQTSNPEYSSAEVTASLARKLYDVQQGTATGHENIQIKQNSGAAEIKTFPVLVQQSSGSLTILPSHITSSEGVKEQHVIPESGKDMVKLISRPIKSQHVDNYENDLQNIAAVPKESILNIEDSATLPSIAGQHNFDERDVLPSRSILGSVKREENVDGGSEKDNLNEHILETNRQFLLSFSNRGPSVNRIDQNSSCCSVINDRNPEGSNFTPSVNKNHQPNSSDASGSHSSNMRTDLGRGKTILWNTRNGSSRTNGALILTNSISSHENRHTHPLSSVMGSKADNRMPSEVISSIVTQEKQSNKSHILSSSNSTYPTSLQTSFHDTSSLDRVTSTSLEGHQFHIKPSPLITSSTSSVFCDVAHAHKDVYGNANNFDDLNSNLDGLELPPLEIDDLAPGGDKVGRKGDMRKKLKDGGKFNSSDGLPKASDDPVGARKKMHFKSSIKNLFSKKKGQVILADVEREVVREMTSTTTEGTATKLSKNAEYIRNTKVGNSLSRSPVTSCAPQKTLREAAIEMKTRKDQFGSNVSPDKVYKRFHFHVKVNKPKTEDLSESKHCQQEQTVLESLKAHNKRHGIVIDSNDTQFTDALDKGIDFAGTTRQNNESKEGSYDDYNFQGRNGLTYFQQFLQKRPQSSYTCETEKNGTGLCSKSASSLNQKVVPKYYQSHTVQDELPSLKYPHTTEANPLKSTPDVCNINSSHRAARLIQEHLNSSKIRVRAEKYLTQSFGESHVKRSHSSSHDLCMQCQKCEIKQKERVTDCERTLYTVRPGHNVKNCGPEVCGTHLCRSNKLSLAASPEGKSEGDISNSTVHISTNVLLNDLNDGKKPPMTETVSQVSLTSEPASVSCSERLKNSIEPKSLHGSEIISSINSSHSLTYLGQQQRFEERSKHYTASPVQKQTTPSGCHQWKSPNMMTYNMPDVTKVSVGVTCSKNMREQNALTGVSAPNSSVGEAVNLVSAIDICHDETKRFPANSASCSTERNSPLVLNTSLLDNCGDKKISVTQSSISAFPETIGTATSLGNFESNISQTVPSEIRPHFKQQPNALDYSSRSKELPKTFPNRECRQSVIKEEADNEDIVKRFSLDDKAFLEHRYRLYYDDETNSSRNLKQSENPKSLKALSASSVIAENFKQLPRNTNSSYDRNHTTYNQAAFYLTVSSPSVRLSERKASLIHAESKLTGVSGTTCSLQSHTNLHLNSGNILTHCNSEPLSQFSDYSSQRVTDHEILSADNDHREMTQTNCSPISHAEEMDELNGKYSDLLPPGQLESEENETSLKHYQTGTSLEKERNTSSGLQATPSFSDESSSYKPKNPQPISNLVMSSAPESQSSRLLRGEKSSTDYYPYFSLKNISTLQLSSSKHEADGSSLNLPPCKTSASYNPESNERHTRQFERRPQDDIKGPESYNCQQSRNDSLFMGSHSFLRSSSPSDFFSIRPYRLHCIKSQLRQWSSCTFRPCQ